MTTPSDVKRATVAELDGILHTLDLPRARLVCGLVLAVHEGGEAVERWIAEHGGGRGLRRV